MRLERSNGKWGSVITLVPTESIKPSKFEIKMWFFNKLVENIDCQVIQDDLIKAVADGDLTQKDVDIIIERAIQRRKELMYKNVANLLAGSTSRVFYNHSTGENEPKPPFGWGQ